MRSILPLVSLPLAFLFAACGGSDAATTRVEVQKEKASVVKQAADTIGKVKDSETAKAAKAELDKLVEQYKNLQQKLKGMAELPPEQQAEAMQKQAAEIKKDLALAWTNLTAQFGKLLMKPEVKEVLQPVIDKFKELRAQANDGEEK